VKDTLLYKKPEDKSKEKVEDNAEVKAEGNIKKKEKLLPSPFTNKIDAKRIYDQFKTVIYLQDNMRI
jgi:hypothetical protein